jgi:O-antigen/teichoic acid export membrane protein
MATDVGAPSSAAGGTGGLGRVVRGFGALAASNFASQLIAFAALAYVARRTGATNLGAYTFALLLATYFNLFSSVGIDYLATRDIAQGRSFLAAVVGETLFLQGLLSVVLYIALVAMAPLLVANHEVQRILPIVGLTILTSTFTLDWALLALRRSGNVAIWRLVGQVTYASLVPLLVIDGENGIIRYAWLNVLGLVVTSAGLMWVFSRVTAVRLRLSRPRVLARRLRRSLPFGYSLIMIQIYGGVGTLMLGYLDSTHAVGIYAVASKLPWALVALANIWINVFFPHTAQRLAVDPRGFAQDLGRVVTATLVISAAVAAGAFLSAGTLMTTMFGPSFYAAAEPFALLSFAAALVLLQANFSNVLLASGSQRYFVVVMTIAAVLIVGLNFIFIPLLGTIGAAISTVIGEMGLTTATFVGARRRLGPIPLEAGRLVRGGIAVTMMAVSMFAARSVGGAVVQIGVALLTFAVAALVLRAFDPALVRRAEAVAH